MCIERAWKFVMMRGQSFKGLDPILKRVNNDLHFNIRNEKNNNKTAKHQSIKGANTIA